MDDVHASKLISNGDVALSKVCYKLPLDNLSYKDFDIHTFQKFAGKKGLKHALIMEVICAIESEKLFTDEKLELMKCLIPSTSIPEEAFLRLSCLLSHFEFSMEIKVEILKWMITVYTFVESLGRFRLLYELFLQLLREDELRPYACHLLYLLTDKSNVTTHRVEYLRKIMETYDDQPPCLIFLLLTYYKQSPDCFDEEIRESVKYQFCSLGVYPDLIKGVHPSYEINFPSGCVSTFEADSSDTESCAASEGEGSHNLLPANSQYRKIFQEFKVLEKSRNISKILKSTYRRLFLTGEISMKTRLRIYDFILTSLYDEENFNSRDFLLEILEIFHDMLVSMVGMSDFTEMFISSWDGKSNLDIITSLLQYQPICCFQSIIYKMDLIRERLFKANIHTKCELFYCLSKMYENWVLIQHDRFPSIPCHDSCLSLNDESPCTSHLPKDEIEKLGTYIDSICDTLIADSFSPCLLNEILLHYERISMIHMHMVGLDFPRLPSYPVFGASLFSCSSLTLDNLSRLMRRYNVEIQQMQCEEIEDAKRAAMHFKLYTYDIHNFLFDGQNENTYLSKTNVFSRLKELYPKFTKVFQLYRHPALLMKTVRFLEKYPQYKTESGPILKRNLLQYLSENGLQNLIIFESLLRS